jgi:hypothetical protein
MKIVKVFVIAIFTIFWVLNIEAQNISYGITYGGGISISKAYNTSGDTSYDPSFYPVISFNVDGFFEYKLSKSWALSAEAGFIRKGGKSGGFNRHMEEIVLRLNYIHIPIMAKYYATKWLSFSIGPEFAYLLNSKESLTFYSSGLTDFRDDAFEISAMIAMNFSISRKFDLGFRYNHGLTKIVTIQWLKFPDNTLLGKSDVYNQYFLLFMRFKINNWKSKK